MKLYEEVAEIMRKQGKTPEQISERVSWAQKLLAGPVLTLRAPNDDRGAYLTDSERDQMTVNAENVKKNLRDGSTP